MSISSFCIEQRQKEQQERKKLIAFGLAGSAVLHGMLASALIWLDETQVAQEPIELIIVEPAPEVPPPKPEKLTEARPPKPVPQQPTETVAPVKPQPPATKTPPEPVPPPKPVPPTTPPPPNRSTRTSSTRADCSIITDSTQSRT